VSDYAKLQTAACPVREPCALNYEPHEEKPAATAAVVKKFLGAP